MVAIRYGSQTIDPVTGLVATVVGIRLDVFKKMPVPVTAACWLMMAEQTNSVQVWRQIIFFWQTFTLSYLFLLALLHFFFTLLVRLRTRNTCLNVTVVHCVFIFPPG